MANRVVAAQIGVSSGANAMNTGPRARRKRPQDVQMIGQRNDRDRVGRSPQTIEIAQNQEIGLAPLMDPNTVEKLERKIEEAITEVILKMGLKRLPLLPSHHTVQMMAKAAVAVYETAVESGRQEE